MDLKYGWPDFFKRWLPNIFVNMNGPAEPYLKTCPYQKRYPKVSQKCPKSNPKVAQKSPKRIPKVSQQCPNSVPKMFQKCSKSVPKVSQQSPKSLPKVSQKYLKNVPKMFQKCPKNAPMSMRFGFEGQPTHAMNHDKHFNSTTCLKKVWF